MAIPRAESDSIDVTFLKSLARRVPAVRQHLEKVSALCFERDRLADEVTQLTSQMKVAPRGQFPASTGHDDWSLQKQRKKELSEAYR